MDQSSYDSDNWLFPTPGEFEQQYAGPFEAKPVPESFQPDLPRDMWVMRFVKKYSQCLDECLNGRSFFVTDSGHMGYGSYDARVGDCAAILIGSDWCLF